MALTQDQRVAMSAKIVSVPEENSNADKSKASIAATIVQAQNNDNTNKLLMDQKTLLVNAYQTERQNIDGLSHTQLTEQMVQDGARRVLGNYFFPNEQNVALPFEASGVWKFFVPYYYSFAVGKTKFSAYGSVNNEGVQLPAALAQITILESKTLITRVTGQFCSVGVADPGPPPIPAGPDVIAADAPTQAALTALIAAVNAEKTLLLAEQAALNSITETDSTRAAQNTAALTSISTAITAINVWLAVTSFNTAHGQITCAGFNSYNASLLFPTKADTSNLATIKSALNARTSYTTTRLGQLNTNLGIIVQNTIDGAITTATGLYGERAKIIGLRLNAIGGSLVQVNGLQNSVGALEQLKTANNNAVDVYASVMLLTTFEAPANGTGYLNVTSSAGFAAGNTVYVASASQPEMAAYIKEVQGNRILLDRQVPPTYKQSDKARLYKML